MGVEDPAERLTAVSKHTDQHPVKLSVWDHWTLAIYIFSPALKGFASCSFKFKRQFIFLQHGLVVCFGTTHNCSRIQRRKKGFESTMPHQVWHLTQRNCFILTRLSLVFLFFLHNSDKDVTGQGSYQKHKIDKSKTIAKPTAPSFLWYSPLAF